MGTFDAQGIYQYDNADNPSPFPDLLNLLGGSVASQLSADRARLTALETNPGTSTWNLDPAWKVSSGFALTYLAERRRCTLEGTVIERASSTLAVAGGADYVLSTALPVAVRPARPQFAGTFMHFGTTIPTPARIEVGSNGIIRIRCETGGSFPTGPTYIVVIPPMTWITP